VEEELHLVAQRLLVRARERVRTSEPVDNGERGENGVLLVDLDTECQLESPCVSSQLLALVKVHLRLAELVRRQHVEHLADIRVGTLDELVNNVGGDLELFAGGLARVEGGALTGGE